MLMNFGQQQTGMFTHGVLDSIHTAHSSCVLTNKQLAIDLYLVYTHVKYSYITDHTLYLGNLPTIFFMVTTKHLQG